MNKFTEFGNQTLRITTAHYPPFTIRHVAPNGTVTFDGLCIRIVEAMAQALHFRYELYQIEDGRFGSTDENGTWIGMVGDVVHGKADMAAAAITINTARDSVVDFTVPFWEEPSGVLVRREEDNSNMLLSVFQPLHAWVWLFLLAAAIVTTVSLYILSKLHLCMVSKTKKKDYLACHIGRSLFYFATSFLNQGQVYHPSSTRLRCVCGCWLFVCLVIYATYTGNLMAFLTVSTQYMPFNTLDEMVAQSEYTYGTSKGNVLQQVFEAAPGGVYKEIHKNLVLVDWNVIGFEKVRKEKYAHMADLTVLRKQAAEDCSLQVIKETFYKVGLGFAVPEGWPHRKAFDDVILRLIGGGFMEKWAKDSFPSLQCAPDVTVEASHLTLSQMAGCFILLFIGLFVSVLVMVSELVIHKIKE